MALEAVGRPWGLMEEPGSAIQKLTFDLGHPGLSFLAGVRATARYRSGLYQATKPTTVALLMKRHGKDALWRRR